MTTQEPLDYEQIEQVVATLTLTRDWDINKLVLSVAQRDTAKPTLSMHVAGLYALGLEVNRDFKIVTQGDNVTLHFTDMTTINRVIDDYNDVGVSCTMIECGTSVNITDQELRGCFKEFARQARVSFGEENGLMTAGSNRSVQSLHCNLNLYHGDGYYLKVGFRKSHAAGIANYHFENRYITELVVENLKTPKASKVKELTDQQAVKATERYNSRLQSLAWASYYRLRTLHAIKPDLFWQDYMNALEAKFDVNEQGQHFPKEEYQAIEASQPSELRD